MNTEHHDTERLLRCLWQTRAALSDAMDAIAAAVGTDAAGQARQQPADASAKVVGPAPRHATSVDYPRVGGRGFRPSHSAFFASAAWRAVPLGDTREIYVGRSTGLAAISRRLKLPAYKPGTCMRGKVWQRIRELRDVRYGAAYRHGDAILSDVHGFDDWFPSRLDPRLGPSPMSPVTVSDNAIAVPLPEDLPWQLFDDAFDARVRRGSLYTWLGTDHGRHHCMMVGADPLVGQRYTVYPGGAAPRISPAMEICVIDTFNGADRLIAIAEALLVEHATTGIAVEG